jgi:hypothetical protein
MGLRLSSLGAALRLSQGSVGSVQSDYFRDSSGASHDDGARIRATSAAKLAACAQIPVLLRGRDQERGGQILGACRLAKMTSVGAAS